VRKLIRLRRQHPQFRSNEHYFYNHHEHYLSKDILLFSRQHGNTFSLIALNFGDQEQKVPFNFPISGDYREELHGQDKIKDIAAGEEVWLTIPSNYGRIWTLETQLGVN